MCLCKTPITFIDLTIITFLASENQHGSESKMSWLQWLLLYVYQIRRLELGVLVSSDEFLTLAKLVSASCNQKLKGVVVGTLRPDVAVKWGKKNYFKTTAMIVFFVFLFFLPPKDFSLSADCLQLTCGATRVFTGICGFTSKFNKIFTDVSQTDWQAYLQPWDS